MNEHEPPNDASAAPSTPDGGDEALPQAATTRPMQIDQLKSWADSADNRDEDEAPPPFASPNEAAGSFRFAEDSQSIPAPAPFAVINQGAKVTPDAAPEEVAEEEADETAEQPPVSAPDVITETATAAGPSEPAPEQEKSKPIGSLEASSSSLDPAARTPPAVTPPPYLGPPAADRRLAQAIDVMARLRARMGAQILGRDEVIELVLVALLADGHVLLEDFPGSGKTTLAKALGGSIIDQEVADDIAEFRRIQFTPDLLPSDVTGVSVFDINTNSFHFRRGPIFAHVVLADEINRTSPKVQSAMLEAMAEKQVTVDNVTYALDPLFFVIATQNPLDLAGTYPLPVAQLDRFLFKIRMQHIDRASELEVLNTYRQRRDSQRQDLPKVARLDVLAARKAIDEHVAIGAPVKECLVDITHALRNDERVLQGNSTRSLVLMLPALQALAVLRSRDYVSSDDIRTLIPRVLGHRVELAPGVNDLEQVLQEVMEEPIERLARSTMRRG